MSEYSTPTSTVPELHQRAVRSSVPVVILAGSHALLGRDAGVHRLGPSLRLGRARSASEHLRLESSSTSREHAVIVREEDGFSLHDLGSRNGTYVDGRVLRGQAAVLHDGSMVIVGGFLLFFRLLTIEMEKAMREEERSPLGPVPSRSPRVCLLNRRIRLLAASDAMLVGETGTGKDVYARATHGLSGRAGPFVALNCASVPKALAESELFGYVRGAHSQAADRKHGLIQSADGGTLFLDELGEMPTDVQAKLLRFLQTREFIPLGATAANRVDVRVIAATNRSDDDTRVRADLRHRLGEPLRLPPLRRRREDIPSLVQHFVGTDRRLTSLAFQALLLYGWPGNIRELEHCLRRAHLLSEGADSLDLCHFPGAIGGYVSHVDDDADERGPAPRSPHNRAGVNATLSRRRSPRPRPSRAELERLLAEHHGRVAEIARELDRRWQVVWKWLRADNLDPAAYRGERSDDDAAADLKDE